MTDEQQPQKPRRNPPAFQFYADDFISGTADMAPEEVGAYIRLLCWQWNRGCIPVEPERQQRLAGGCVSAAVLSKFELCEDGALRNARMEKVRENSDGFRKMQSEKGKKSALARARFNTGSTAVQPEQQPNPQPECNSPSPSPSPKDNKRASVESGLELGLEKPSSQWEIKFGLELPENLRTQNCLDAVREWLKYKAERREGYKPTGLKASLTKWGNEFTPANFPQAIQNSMASGWSGVFPPKPQGGPSPAQGAPSLPPTRTQKKGDAPKFFWVFPNRPPVEKQWSELSDEEKATMNEREKIEYQLREVL